MAFSHRDDLCRRAFPIAPFLASPIARDVSMSRDRALAARTVVPEEAETTVALTLLACVVARRCPKRKEAPSI